MACYEKGAEDGCDIVFVCGVYVDVCKGGNAMWVWKLLTFMSGTYVFLGLWVNGVATASENWKLLALALVICVLNLSLLGYARSKPWL